MTSIVDSLNNLNIGLFPCDTIWGLIGKVDISVCDRLRQIKDRDGEKPFIWLAKDIESAQEYIDPPPAYVRHLQDRFWPGPLTLIFNRAHTISPALTNGHPTLAIRVPKFAPLQELLRQLDHPIYSTSANISGEPAIQHPDELPPSLNGQLDFIASAHHPPLGVASTIVDVTDSHPRLIREGAILFSDIESVIDRL